MTRGRAFFALLLKISVVAIASVVLLATGFELFLRQRGFLQAQPANYPCVTGDPELNHVFQKNCRGAASAESLKTDRDVIYQTNSMGTRGPSWDPKRPAVVVLGDSYTEGFGLNEEETFPARLGEAWAKAGSSLQVLNGGTLGFSPILYGPYFRRYFANLRPKLVLLNLDFTDLGDDAYFAQIADLDAQGMPLAFPGRDIFPSWLLPYVYGNQSALLRFLHGEVNQWHQIKRREQAAEVMDRWIQASPVSDGTLAEHQLTACAKPIRLTVWAIQRLRDEVDRAGGRLAIHMYPPGYMVKSYPTPPQSISFVSLWDQKTRRDFSWSCGPNERLVGVIREFAAREKIPFFDSFPVIKTHPHKERLYFARDAHWTEEGVRVVVASLAPALLRELRKP